MYLQQSYDNSMADVADPDPAKTQYRKEIFTTIPPQPSEKKIGQLSPEQIREFFEKVSEPVHPDPRNQVSYD